MNFFMLFIYISIDSPDPNEVILIKRPKHLKAISIEHPGPFEVTFNSTP